MNIGALIALLLGAYNTKKDVTGDDNPDAVIETIMPEVAKYFASLFKGDVDGFFTALNALVFGLYHISGDAFQFFIRLMVNMKAEKLQARYPWMSLPFLIFIKGYFNALEEATKGKPKPSANDIEAAADKVAAEAKKAASDLKSKFDAAKEAAKGMRIPHSNPNPKPDGGHVADPRPSPARPSGGAPPAAGGTGKSLEERINDLTAMLPALKAGYTSAKEHLSEMVKDAEGVAQNLAYALIGLVIAMVSTGLMHGFIVVKAPEWVWAVTVVFTLLWGLVPLFIGLVAVAKAENGFMKLASAGTAILLTGGVSSLVIATIDGFAVLGKHFSWVYVASGLAAIVLGDFIWRLGDLLGDFSKAIIRMIPDGWEADWMKRPTIGFRKAMFTIAVAYSAFMFLMGLYAQWEHTLYGVGAVGLLVLCLLMAAYGYSRVSLTTNDAADDLNEVVTVHRLQNLDRFYWTATGFLLLLLTCTFGFNALVPPQCPDKDNDPDTVDVCETTELPSYATRWKASRVRTVGANIADKAMGAIDPGDGGNGASTCAPQVKAYVRAIKDDTCKVILEESLDPELFRLCSEAVECGALQDDGFKKPAVAHKGGLWDAGFNWWWAVGVGALVLLVLVVIGLFVPEKKDEKKEETKKSAAH